MPREVYQFQAVGQAEVLGVYRSVVRESRAAARQVQAAEAAMRRAVSSPVRSGGAGAGRGGPYRSAAAEEVKQMGFTAAQRERHEVRLNQLATRNVHQRWAAERREAERSAQARVRAEQRANAAIQRAGERRLGRIGDRVGGAVSGIATAGALGAAMLFGGAARDSIRLGEVATRMGINARAAGAAPVDTAQLKRQFENVALTTPGFSAMQVGEAALEFQSRTGSVMSTDEMQTLATAASAAGADMGDLAKAMAAMRRSLKVENVDDMQQSLSDLISQGARGNFELKDAAAMFDRLTAAAGRFGIGHGPEAVRTLGGLTQIARGATGNRNEATTSLENVFTFLTAKQGQLKEEGVEVFDEQGAARPIIDVLLETIQKVGGDDLAKKRAGLQGIFGIRGTRAIAPLMQAFIDATLAGKDGLEAMRAKVADAAGTAGTWKDRVAEAATAQQTASARISSAMERVKATVSDELVPQLMPLIEKLPELVGMLGPLISAFASVTDVIVEFGSFLETLPGFSPSDATQRRRAQRELEQVNLELNAAGLDATPEQIQRKQALEAQIAGLDAVQDARPDAAIEIEERLRTQQTGATMLGTGIGYAVGGKGGAVVGGALAEFAGAGAAGTLVSQADAGLAPTPVFEGHETGMMTDGGPAGYFGQKAKGGIGGAAAKAMAAAGIDTTKIEGALGRAAEAADRFATAAAKLEASSQASILGPNG